MKKTLDIKLHEAWKHGLQSWNTPSIPQVIAPKNKQELTDLGEIGTALHGQLAFMKYPEFQTYMNLENIVQKFPTDPARGAQAIAAHEVGHRFCPYDVVTTLILNHAVKKALQGQTLPYSVESAAHTILNLFTDTCINTRLTQNGNEHISWAYTELSKDTKQDSKLWRVYGKSMELLWKKDILPTKTKLSREELHAATELAALFERDYFNRDTWKQNSVQYAQIISPFLENEKKDGEKGMDATPGGNMPRKLEEKTAQELAKKLAHIGSDGLPQNPQGMKEFQEIMAGFGKGDAKHASIQFYDMLSQSYDVMFATKPFGRPRTNPFQPVRWNPSMGAETLDVDYSVQVSGRIVPGVNTYKWNTRKRDAFGGMEEVVPNLDIYLDTSMSMPNPLEQISLPVLAGFVAAKKAHRKGAYIRATNFSGDRQVTTQDSTRDLRKVFENLVIHYNGGTVFPTDTLLAEQDPKQVMIITDTFLGNETETGEAIAELRKRHKGNRVTVYEIQKGQHGQYLRNAGAEVINGTSTDIFKRVIGKADEVYLK
ncbi:MAG: hypothetical protein Q7R87_04250 [Nanoarchaeota archaeon]|nr:hypothetical protein [Nanoarchaeota archaeon]